MDGTKRIGESNTLTLTTMDTTSHNFTWEIDTLGISLSYLNDVWIVDENDIWVVGALSIDDSTLEYPGHTNYNAAHWDGEAWEMMKIHSGAELNAIHYFSENDIWVSSGGYPAYWDGNEWTMYRLHDMGINSGYIYAIWGTSSSNMYFVGRTGSIVHYDGSEFVKMESGRDVDLKDIDGTEDGEYIFIVGNNFYVPGESQALMITNGIITELYYSDYGIPVVEGELGSVTSVSVNGDTTYFVTMGGLWKYNFIHQTSKIINELDNYGYREMIVQAPNDIFTLGGGFNFVHFNGVSWDHNRLFLEMYDFSSGGADYKDNLVVTVGYTHGASHAIIARGSKYYE